VEVPVKAPKIVHGICNQHSTYAGNLVVLDEAALLTHSYESSNVVEEIHKQKRE
jgi:hypothetical protein